MKPVAFHEILGEKFFVRVKPAEFNSLTKRYRNQDAAKSVSLDKLNEAQWQSYFGEFKRFPDSFETPLALCYHGHQFGIYNKEIGDGRLFRLRGVARVPLDANEYGGGLFKPQGASKTNFSLLAIGYGHVNGMSGDATKTIDVEHHGEGIFSTFSGGAEVVAKCGVTRESGWLYFIDKDGDVSRAKMARGRK